MGSIGKVFKYKFQIMGTYYKQFNIEEGMYYISSKDNLKLECEPDNNYDEYAIKVLLDDQHIGYIEKNPLKTQLFQLLQKDTTEIIKLEMYEYDDNICKERYELFMNIFIVSKEEE